MIQMSAGWGKDGGFDLSIPPPIFVETDADAKYWRDRYMETWKQNNGLGLDSETTGLTRHKDVVIIWSLSDGETRICLDVKWVDYFRCLLENPEIPFDLTNARFDAHMFANVGIDISKCKELRDTVVMSWLINENNQGRHGLKECIKEHFGRVTPSFDLIFGKMPPKKKGVAVTTPGHLIRAALADPIKREKAIDYASLDAYNSTTLRAHFDKMMSGVSLYDGMSLKDFYYMVEVPFTKVLWKMERRGVTVDKGFLKTVQAPMEAEMERIEKEFAKHSGKVMKLGSSAKDPKWFFFEVLQKPITKYTDGGATGIKQPSMDSEVLEEWAGQGCEHSQRLLTYRKIEKIYGTYVMGLQEHMDNLYRVHSSLNQSGTVTGRLSSTDPNLQNIPRPGEDKFKIRESFIPAEAYQLVVADYEQLEMRLMAHFSGDEKMINAIRNNIDLHCLTVTEIYGFPYDDCMKAKKAEKKAKEESNGLEDWKNPDMDLPAPNGKTIREYYIELLLLRQAAKATGFGIIYGIGGPLLAANLTKDLGKHFTPEEGIILIKKWFSVFPGVQKYIEVTKKFIWDHGYVQTILGRYRRFGDLKGMSKQDRALAERQGVNSIVQGSASDIAKMAMLRAEYDPELLECGARLLLQVHDELMFECPDIPEIIKRVKNRVKELMENPFGPENQLKVPLPASVGSGYSWATAK